MFKRRKSIGLWRKVRNLVVPEIGYHRTVKYFSHRMNRIAASPHAIALGFAAGAFASFTPAVGLHFVIAAIIAWFIGANVLASAIGTSVGNPLTFPFIWISTHNVGSWILGAERREDVALSTPEGGIGLLLTSPVQFTNELWAALEPVFWPMVVGSLPLGLTSAAICYFGLKPVIARYKARREEVRRRRRRAGRTGAGGRGDDGPTPRGASA